MVLKFIYNYSNLRRGGSEGKKPQFCFEAREGTHSRESAREFALILLFLLQAQNTTGIIASIDP